MNRTRSFCIPDGAFVRNASRDAYESSLLTIRRIIDLNLALLLILFTCPVWVVIALAIKIDSRGSVFYTQERVGRGNRIFRIFKFRTMCADAEKMTGPVLSQENDPRITRIGRFLRMTRLDEIPQFLNVLFGDMSFIGPRPERMHFVEIYSREIPMYGERHRLPPGITGLAQVRNGYDRGIDDVRKKLEYDLMYLRSHSSPLLNLKILFLTFSVVVT